MFSRLPILLITVIFSVVLPACGKGEKAAENPIPPKETQRDFKVIHTFVALCDNKSQGIAPVPEKIGNGDDPANNLYWGCTDGSRSYFSKSKKWKRRATQQLQGLRDRGLISEDFLRTATKGYLCLFVDYVSFFSHL